MPYVQPTVNVVVTRIISGSSVGYQIQVEPWLVAPDDGDIVDRINWNFRSVGASFSEFKLDFKSKDHFAGAVDVSGAGTVTEHYVLEDPVQAAAATPAGQTVGSAVNAPDDLNAQDYEYIIEFKIDGGPRVELDPGYRVKP
jgi:hypothetical protein